MIRAAFGENAEAQITLRKRMAGDFITIFGGKTKKLQDYLVDRKIPKDERDSVELVAINREILLDSAAPGQGPVCSQIQTV